MGVKTSIHPFMDTAITHTLFPREWSRPSRTHKMTDLCDSNMLK